MADYDPSRDPNKSGNQEGLGVKYGDLIVTARENSRRDNFAWGDSFRAQQDDQLFLVGQQWDPTDKADRRAQGLVTLTINDLGQFLDQVVGDMRKNPTSIKVAPNDFAARSSDFVSTSGRRYSQAEVRMGLIREVEYQSNATIHYAMAGQHAAESGLGWLRVYADYLNNSTKPNDESFIQKLCVERIKNRWSVLPDSMRTQPDFSDMDHAFVGTWMKLEEYNRRFPGTAPGIIGSDYTGYWGNKEGYVRLAEYYYREPVTINVLQLDNGNCVTDEDKKVYEIARVSGHVINQRKLRSFRVKWCKMSFQEVVEEPITLPGSTIPLVPVLGKVIEGVEDDFIYGLFRFAKDPKMMENYWLSSATQRIAQMPVAPWLVTDNMIKGKTNEWAEANRGAKGYLSWKVDPDATTMTPQKISPAQVPAGEMQLILAFADKTKATVGFHDAAIGEARNKQSGIAIERLQQESDTGSFVFTDNLRMAVGRVGKLMDEWLPVIYDTERFITVRADNGETDIIEINKVDETGNLVNDLSAGSYDVHAEAGPAYSTLREEAASDGLELLKTLAQVGDGNGVTATADIVVENMDFPGADRMSKRLRKMVPANLIDDSERTPEERNAPPPPPTPQQQAANAMAQAQMLKAQAEGAKASATVATAEATKATAHATEIVAAKDIVEATAPQPAGDQPGGAAGDAGGIPLDQMREVAMNVLAEVLAQAQPAANPGNAAPAAAPAQQQPQPAPGASPNG